MGVFSYEKAIMARDALRLAAKVRDRNIWRLTAFNGTLAKRDEIKQILNTYGDEGVHSDACVEERWVRASSRMG